MPHHRNADSSSSGSCLLSSSPLPPMRSSSPNNGLLSPSRTGQRKEKRAPSVTPRRFGRFFTPRSNLSLPTSRRILGNLDSSAVNRQPLSPQSLFSDPLAPDLLSPSPTRRLGNSEDDTLKRKRVDEHVPMSLAKRRGFASHDVPMPPPQLILPQPTQPIQDEDVSMSDTPPSSQESLESLADRRKATLSQFFKASRGGAGVLKKEKLIQESNTSPAISKGSLVLEGYQPAPIRKFGNRGFDAQLLDREHGFSARAGRQYLTYPACDSRSATASFYSRSTDVHQVVAHDRQGNTIPFSLASCHAAPVTAIGDEEGFVRFFNTTMTSNSGSGGPADGDGKVDVHFKVHDNAIMSMAFSDDDLRLATACGDRTGRIVDTPTQTVAAELNGGHWDSLRQVSFQPGQANGSMLATSDRAGRIQIWDLRCAAAPVNTFSARHYGGSSASGFGSAAVGISPRDNTLDPLAGRPVNTLDNAHERTVQTVTSPASVTAIHWFPAGREHLLLSASEANAAIRLWDTRYIRPRRLQADTPLAVTAEPASHAWRSYGITSLALDPAAARLYAVCKDSTVYAYSAAHLLLGHAPELLPDAAKRRPAAAEGLGPLYGFKHPQLRVQSFYVKCALRPRRNAHAAELLAVGSSDSCAVLIPTDERYLRAATAARAHCLDAPATGGCTPATPSQSLSGSCTAASSSPVPIFRVGTPLIRGHAREVTTPSWTHDGKLVTASDDYSVRQWQEDDAAARHLRQVGEFGGERHMAGWADVGDDWDVEEDDDEEEE